MEVLILYKQSLEAGDASVVFREDIPCFSQLVIHRRGFADRVHFMGQYLSGLVTPDILGTPRRHGLL
jgi:hypothetical protein